MEETLFEWTLTGPDNALMAFKEKDKELPETIKTKADCVNFCKQQIYKAAESTKIPYEEAIVLIAQFVIILRSLQTLPDSKIILTT